jgi:hypothetical protein
MRSSSFSFSGLTSSTEAAPCVTQNKLRNSLIDLRVPSGWGQQNVSHACPELTSQWLTNMLQDMWRLNTRSETIYWHFAWCRKNVNFESSHYSLNSNTIKQGFIQVQSAQKWAREILFSSKHNFEFRIIILKNLMFYKLLLPRTVSWHSIHFTE